MEKYWKWLGIAFWIIVLLAGSYLMFNTERDSFMNEKGNAVITFFDYIKAVDGWNVIFAIIFFSIVFVAFLLINYVVDRALKAIVKRKPNWSWLNSKAADFAIQHPLAILIVFFVFLLATNLYVEISGSRQKITSAASITDKKVVVVLGTSKYLSSGKGINKYYEYRMTATSDLYKSGAVKYIIVSGDGLGEAHAAGTYNETKEMRADLIAQGIPEELILVDSLGLRTTDSALRLIAVFKTNDVIYVSQSFHTTRAVVQSQFYGIHAKAYDAKGTANARMIFKELVLSRPGLVFDMMIANVQPRIEGKTGGAVEYRHKFEVTSNRHVGIIFLLGVLIWIFFRGANKWLDASKEQRPKLIKKFAIWISASLTAVTILVIQVYERYDFKFTDDLYESFAAVVNVKTEKMVVKEQKALEKKVEIEKIEKVVNEIILAKVNLRTIQDTTSINTVQPVAEEPVSMKKEDHFNTGLANEKPVVAEKVVDKTPEASEEAEEEDFFNTAKGAKPIVKKQTAPVEETVEKPKYFKARVHMMQTITNDGTIIMKLDEPVKIGSITYNKNHIFEATTILLSNKIIIVSSELHGNEDYEVKNYEAGKEGNKIQARYLGKKDEVVLAEGETFSFKVIK